MLKILLEKGLITKEIHDRSREKILAALDWPEFFRCDEDGEEKCHGRA